MALDNTIALLTNISKKLDIITSNLASTNNPGKAQEQIQKTIINNRTTGLNNVNTATTNTNTKKKEVEKNVISKSTLPNQNISIKDVVDFLGGLPAMVKAVTKLDNSELKKFERVLSKLSTSISDFAKKTQTTKLSNGEVKNIKASIDAISSLSGAIKKISILAPVIPLFNLSLLMLRPAVKTMNKLVADLAKTPTKENRQALVSLNLINRLITGVGIVIASTIALAVAIKVLGIKTILEGVGLSLGVIAALSGLAIAIVALTPVTATGTAALQPILKFIAGMTAIAAATFALGLIFSTQASAIFLGLAGVTAVLTGYTLVTTAALFLGSFVQLSWPFLAGILKFGAWGIVLAGATIFLGTFITAGWNLLLAGLGGVVAILSGYTLVALTALGIATILNVIDKTNALMPIIKFSLWGVFLGAMTIALGKFLQDNEWATTKAFALVTAIVGSTVALAKLILEIDKKGDLERAGKGLWELGKFLALCEGFAAGLIFIGKRLKDHEAETAEAFVLMQGIVWSGFGLAAAIDAATKGRGKSLENAANAMMKLGAFMGIGEGLALGLVAVGALLKSHEGDTTKAFLLVQSIVWSGFGLAAAIDATYRSDAKSLDNAAKAMFKIGAFMAISEGLVAGIALIGRLIKGYEKETLEAFLLVETIVWSGFGLAVAIDSAIKGRAKSLSNAADAMFKIGAFMAICEVLAFGIVKIGQEIEEVGSSRVWEAFGMFTAIIVEAAALAALANTFKTQIQQGAMALLPVSALMIAAAGTLFGVIELLKVKQENNIEWTGVLEALGMMGLIVVEFGALAAVAGLVAPQIMAGMPGLSLCEALAVGAGLVLFGVVKLTDYAIDSLGNDWGRLSLTALGMMGLIVTEFGVLAGLAGLAAPFIIAGIPALALCEALAAGAGAILFGVVKLTDYAIESIGENWSDAAMVTLNSMAEIIKKFGILAGVAGFVAPAIIAGSIGLGLCEAVAAGVTGILSSVVKLTAFAIENIGADWSKETLTTITLMEKIITEFGVLAGLAAAAILPITLGLPGLAIITTAAGASIGLIERIVDLRVKLAQADLDNTAITETVETIRFAVNSFVGFIKDVSFGKPLETVRILAKGSQLTKIMNNMAELVTALGSIGMLVTEDGKIRPAKFTEDKLVVGDPVDIIATAKIITTAVKEFTGLISKDFKDISLKDMANAKKAMGTITTMLDPISNFVNALSSFDSVDGKTLHSVKITESGEIKTGPDINLVDVANIIATSISKFAGTLFSTENAEIWNNIISGGNWFRKSPAEKAMGILATVIEPICTFVDCISKFTEGGEESITIVEYDDKGAEKSRRVINIVSIAGAIARCVTSFVDVFVTEADIWKTKLEAKSDRKNVDRGLSIFDTVVDPVVKFMDMVSKFAVTKEGTLAVIDSSGKEHITDFSKIGSTITGAITEFVQALVSVEFSEEEQKIAEIYSSTAKNVTDPISGFIKLISKYADSPEGFLPIIDENGNKTGNVDVLNTTKNILNCTRGFKEALIELQEGMTVNTDNINIASVAISSYITLLVSNASGKNVSTLKTFADVVKSDTTNLKTFDDVLSKGSKSRIKSINELGEAIEKLNDKLSTSNTEMRNLKDLFEAISNSDIDKVRNIVYELSNVNIQVSASGGSEGRSEGVSVVSSGLSQSDIINAIATALESAELYGNIRTTYTHDGTGDTGESRVLLSLDIANNGIGSETLEYHTSLERK